MRLKICVTHLLVFLLGLVWTGFAYSKTIDLIETAHYMPVEQSGFESVKKLFTSDMQKKFRTPGPNGLSFGWVDSPYWIKLQLKPNMPEDIGYLEVPWPLLDNLDIYLVDDNKRLLAHQRFGDHLPFSSRPISDTQFVMPLPNDKQRIKYIYMYVDTTSSLQVPVQFWTTKDYFKNRATYLAGQGIFFGLMLGMIFYNLFIYASTRRAAYLHYVMFVFVFALLQAGLKGLGFQFIWPTFPALNDFAISTGGGFCLLFLSLFARSFLQLDEVKPLLRINNGMLFLAASFILGSLIIPYRLIIAPLAITVILCALLVVGMGVYRYKQGLREARFYLAAWLCMVSGSVLYLIKQLGFMPVNFFTENAMQIGWAFEVVLLSLALADRLNSLRIRIESTNLELEDTVERRTQELVDALEELGTANKRLADISTTDKLTGLRNRYHFDTLLSREIEKSIKHQHIVSLLLLDIDHFKSINDNWGHVIGDQALQFVSERIGQQVKREIDNVCRYGGEEFAIVLPNTNIEGAARLAEKIRAHIESKPFSTDTHSFTINVSIGAASNELMDDVGMDDLIRAADIALYKAKDDGRNCVHIFTGMLTKEPVPPIEKSILYTEGNKLNQSRG